MPATKSYTGLALGRAIELGYLTMAEDFIRDELFKKMGIATYGWQTDVSGLPFAGVRASITSRAMLKVGTLELTARRILPAFVQ